MVAVPLAAAGRPALKVRHAGYTVTYVRMLPDDGSMTAAGFSKVFSGPVCTGRGLHAFHAACSGMPASDADRHPSGFFFTESGQRAAVLAGTSRGSMPGRDDPVTNFYTFPACFHSGFMRFFYG
jgi:hypothetical protein